MRIFRISEFIKLTNYNSAVNTSANDSSNNIEEKGT